MDPVFGVSAVAAIVKALDWKEILKKLAGDAATNAAKAGERTYPITAKLTRGPLFCPVRK